MRKMRDGRPSTFDMLTHDADMVMPKKPDVPYGFVLNPEKAQAERNLAYGRQKIEAMQQYVLPIFDGVKK